ncbi:MAG: Si-specific NAD(P)(+) transhydrogenase [Myxococcales bacterium]|nr:Si-specific NAD(P)(+) transhydrogenase [Myxococcales bacterium]MCB9576682.1 Si-specific NAD(P)(+) transhydrogenase [Polyangiaceae bacterium]
MRENHFDLLVVGAGPAGEKGAAQAAYFGKKVAIVEKKPAPGGAAVHTGTLPSKTLREAALYLSGHRNRDLYGIAVALEEDATLPRLMARKEAIIEAESATIVDNLRRHRIERVSGHARFVDPHTIEVEGGPTLTADNVLIATGSRPRRPPDIDFDDDQIHDSDEVLDIEKLPRSLCVLGAGVIGCEYACMFAALGTTVTMVDTRTEILPFLDQELIDRLRAAMAKLGVDLKRGRRWSNVRRDGDVVTVRLDDGSEIETEQLLFAAGRTGATEGLGLENIGLEPNSRGYLTVDEHYRTRLPHVLAAGDVIGFPALASVSMEQGRVAVCHAFGFQYKKTVAELLPYGIYTIPEVSAVGETEQTCEAKSIPYVVGRALYRNNARGKITGDLDGMTKLIVHTESRKLIGVHVIGERATELVHIGQAVIQLGATVDTFIDMVFNYPSLAESYKYAAYECLAGLARAEVHLEA